MTMYPRLVTLENDKLKKLLTEKSIIVTEGRQISSDIEILETEMEAIDTQIKEIEKTINIDEFHAEEKLLTEQVEACLARLQEIQKEIYAKMKVAVPEELGERYETIKNKKEALETKRNKIALKAQKYNDKIIPLSRKLMKPLLEDQYEDYETIKVEDGQIIATIFSHLNDFKTNFKKK